MDPANPPLPTPMNLPFQFWIGSQSSMLISESDDGLSTICTRQWAGMLAGDALPGVARPAAPRAPGAPGPRAGGGPSGTIAAVTMAASANLRVARLSQGVAAVARTRSAPPIMVDLQAWEEGSQPITPATQNC